MTRDHLRIYTRETCQTRPALLALCKRTCDGGGMVQGRDKCDTVALHYTAGAGHDWFKRKLPCYIWQRCVSGILTALLSYLNKTSAALGFLLLCSVKCWILIELCFSQAITWSHHNLSNTDVSYFKSSSIIWKVQGLTGDKSSAYLPWNTIMFIFNL